MHKIPRNGSECETALTALTINECLLWKEIDDLVLAPSREIAEHLYVQNVMCPLLGPEHVDSGVRYFRPKGCAVCVLYIIFKLGFSKLQ